MVNYFDIYFLFISTSFIDLVYVSCVFEGIDEQKKKKKQASKQAIGSFCLKNILFSFEFDIDDYIVFCEMCV